MPALGDAINTTQAKSGRGIEAERSAMLLRRLGDLPEPKTEVGFAEPVRGWLLDWAWPDRRLGVEFQGGEWIQGRHNRRLAADAEKHNAAVLLGWRVLIFTGRQVDQNPDAVAEDIRQAFHFLPAAGLSALPEWYRRKRKPRAKRVVQRSRKNNF